MCVQFWIDFICRIDVRAKNLLMVCNTFCFHHRNEVKKYLNLIFTCRWRERGRKKAKPIEKSPKMIEHTFRWCFYTLCVYSFRVCTVHLFHVPRDATEHRTELDDLRIFAFSSEQLQTDTVLDVSPFGKSWCFSTATMTARHGRSKQQQR